MDTNTLAKNEAANAVATTAQQILGRATVQNWRGKRADANALEAACGALAATLAIHGNDHPTTSAMSMFATFVGIRGLDYVKERAATAPRPVTA